MKIGSSDKITMSKTPIKNIHSSTQSHGYKPDGLWYGVGSVWLDFVNREFTQARGKYIYKLETNTSSILRIKSKVELQKFSRSFKYKKGIDYSPLISYIDWNKVAKEYGGIEIAPYRQDCRFSIPWYYGWDIASGCIWDASAVTKFELISNKK